MAAVWLRSGLVVSGFAGACFLPLLVSGFVVFGCFGFAVCCGMSTPVVLLFAIGFLGLLFSAALLGGLFSGGCLIVGCFLLVWGWRLMFGCVLI